MPKEANSILNIEEKLKSRTIIDENTKCWLFQGAKDSSGHGNIAFNYRTVGVHRISAHLYLGYDLNDKTVQINHKPICFNANCWNPDHIYIGTQTENMVDMVNRGNRLEPNKYKTHCDNGHEFTEENTYINPNTNWRYCRECNRIKQKNYRIGSKLDG